MIGQTCQKCGQTCTTDEYIVGIGRDAEGCSLYIGEWSRTYVLCSRCAGELQHLIRDFFESASTGCAQSHQTLYARSDEAEKKIAEMLGILRDDESYREHLTDGSDKGLADE